MYSICTPAMGAQNEELRLRGERTTHEDLCAKRGAEPGYLTDHVTSIGARS
jgi:hypothetical protein